MLKTKQRRLAVVAVVIFSMIAMYGGLPTVNAASMEAAKVTLSDSDLGAVGTSTIAFYPRTALVDTNYVQVAFAGAFDFSVATATCPAQTTLTSTTSNTIVCTVNGAGLPNTSTSTILGLNIANPATANHYSITISSHTSGGGVIDSSEVKVYIIDDVLVTAHVAASLTFSVTGIATTTSINGDPTTGSTSPQEIDFKTLAVGSEQRMGQALSVATNAESGFSVTVQQDGNMQSAGGSDIDSFNTAGPIEWAAPSPVVGSESTYGHMGLASDDSNLATPFDPGFYRGLNGVNPLEVMSHNGPTNGLADDSGLVNVIYNIQISAMQEAGDYQNKLTYVCTPTF